MKNLIFTFIIALPLVSQSAKLHPEDHFAHLPLGGRKSLHGMVLFGAGPYFLEHIPMLTPPHDFQIIVQVNLKDEKGNRVSADFSKTGFTFQPSQNFSLNDYVSGRLRSFSGSIHQGSFEQGGKIIPGLSQINVEVVEYKVIRQLPQGTNLEGQWLKVTDGVQTFESNVISPQRNFQLIRNSTLGKNLWCVTGPDFFNNCP